MDASETKPRWASQRRVPRASRACETCRSRKTKCDQAQPCSYCAYHSFNCVYRTSGGRGTARESTAEKKRAMRATQKSQDETIRPSPWPLAGMVQNDIQRPASPANKAPTQRTWAVDSPTSFSKDGPSRALQSAGQRGSTPDTPTVPTENDDEQFAPSELGDAASRDGLSGINLHTKGTEFYGNSSNLAFLGNLFARAQHQSEGQESLLNRDATPTANKLQASSPESRSTPGKSQLSIVNLLYNVDYTGHPSPQSYDGAEGVLQRPYSDVPRSTPGPGNNAQEALIPGVLSKIPRSSQLEIEKIFIASYFTNKHYIHPVLSKDAFMRRCERDAWPVPRRSALFQGTTKFSGLYFAVIALGAINASPNETALLDHFYQHSTDPEKAPSSIRFSALDFAKFYFGVSRQALGDLFESSSLETAQALLLLSVFRQNSLQPHSCYMYSGMAVRTAAAIGLASSMNSLPPAETMKELHHYQASLPKLKIHFGDHDPDAEDNDIAMIPVMVSLAQIMSEASHQLYHSTQLSLREKSHLAMGLEKRLQDWKSNIPTFLNLDANTLSDPEWAFKQKLVLRLRYYNTRILIHRPFFVASTSNTDSSEFRQHLNICIEAARSSIKMQYESFMHRIYIRTWWYNTTYALYGSMILLHLILSNFPGLPDEELLEDVEKSLEIFSSMDDIIVARRCAEMLREVLDVARTFLRRRQIQDRDSGSSGSMSRAAQVGIGDGVGIGSSAMQPGYTSGAVQASLTSHSLLPANSIPVTSATESDFLVPQLSFQDGNGNETVGSSMLGQSGQLRLPDDEDFFFSLFSQEPQQQQQQQQQVDRTRAEMLANLVDPTILEDFAFGGQEFSFF
ncbi:transcriptional regulator family: Fungal Specific TF [Penicillium malachiteum]|uniref:transcriptional regulator family: Fungal Specific TF n=1 Tax=Penicillium malachiteum TaxID=1324776 RepID=UPI002547C41A|nr:transcriptional regulator family: Fungal Specific TF [Penicillium malachiteum]KAJ5720363.1 transcriptional regulator family: Fungal Specific TF [Penicillium malachiteum]